MCVCVDAQTKCPATYVVCVCACVCVSLCECARVSVCEGVSVRKRPAHCTQSSALYARAICVCLCHVKSMSYIMSMSRTEHDMANCITRVLSTQMPRSPSKDYKLYHQNITNPIIELHELYDTGGEGSGLAIIQHVR